MNNGKNKERSPLVTAVLNLDKHFADLERLGNQINLLDMKSDFDFEHAGRLMVRFAESGEGVSREVTALATELQEARQRAETMAQGVSARAEMIRARKAEVSAKQEKFQALAEKVRELNASMSKLKPTEGATLGGAERTALSQSLIEFEVQFTPLIAEAEALRAEAHGLKMKSLEQLADSLAQTLQTARQKVAGLTDPPSRA